MAEKCLWKMKLEMNIVCTMRSSCPFSVSLTEERGSIGYGPSRMARGSKPVKQLALPTQVLTSLPTPLISALGSSVTSWSRSHKRQRMHSRPWAQSSRSWWRCAATQKSRKRVFRKRYPVSCVNNRGCWVLLQGKPFPSARGLDV